MTSEPAPERLLRWAFWIIWGNIHTHFWVRRRGRRFHCPTCQHRFWAIRAEHGFANACPRCMGATAAETGAKYTRNDAR
jgi:uncharacterized paraquat-inducible protein A